MKKKILAVTALLMSSVISSMMLTSCSDKERPEIEYIPSEPERYENPIEIEGQWGASVNTGEDGQYGIGDPFVMRFNGKYYLYPSTSDPYSGIKVFESEDLVHWTDKGFAVAPSDETSHGAYAPEVVYYNGYFYLCQSRAGQGHYIYRSESPTEGFTLISSSDRNEDNLDYGNIGMGIDGSFYVSDDGRLYLLHTSTPAGLKYNEITDISDINSNTLGQTGELGAANLNHWIEGPSIFRRGSFSYLTYTGNHVISSGYRVAYSYAEDLTDLSSFIQPTDNVTLIDTDEEHRGLGHSSNFNGPDLDSVYTAYHNLVGRGPARRYNLDRYFASGSILTANGATHRPVAVPDMPDKGGYAEALTARGGVYELGETQDYFTAEFNFVPASGQELFFGSASGRKYIIRVGDGKISLVCSENGTQEQLGEQSVTIAEGKLATVRVENGDGVGYIYLNGMRVIEYAAEKAAGALGYTQKEGVGYTAYTNDVFGTSDFEAFKNFPTKFPAVTYLKGESRGFSIKNAQQKAGGVRVGEPESTVKVGDANAVVLEKGDWVKYAVDIPQDGAYAISAEVSAASAGATLRITIGDASVETEIPAAVSGAETFRIPLGTLQLSAGVGSMKAEVVSGHAEILLFESAQVSGAQQAELSDYRLQNGRAELSGDALTVYGERGTIAWENTDAVNFEATLTFSCEMSVLTNVGFMIRSQHYSYHPDQPAESWRGYYLQLGGSIVALHRYDYGNTGTLATSRIGTVDLGSGIHTLKIRAQGYTITVTIDDSISLTAQDSCAFLYGSLGVYAGNGDLTIHSLTYKEL